MDEKEKTFGSDVNLFSNLYSLSTIEKYFCNSETELWIFNCFVIPALNKIDGISNVHIAYDDYTFIVFVYKELEYWLNLTMFYNPKLKKWSYKNSFTFYQAWIFGCYKACSNTQMIECTKNAILKSLNDKDAQSTIFESNEEIENNNFKKVFGSDVEIFSNPW